MKLTKVLLAVVVLGIATHSFATENGGGAYPNGAEGFMTGAVPPPGQYLVNYMLYYRARDLMDGSGNAMDVPFDLQVYAEVARFVNVTDIKILGANWAQHVFLPVMYIDAETPGGSDEVFGLYDIIVDPLILSWHTPTLHWALGLDVFVPVGRYDENDVVNVGRNYWTFEPVAAVTYRNKAGYEASAKVMYDINLENDDTDYDSGDELHIDYTVGKYFGPLGVGAGGFFYKQITDDDGMIMTPGGPVDAGVLNGNKGQQWAIGPQLTYAHKGMFFTLKYQHEFETENKPEGDRFWFKFITGF